MRKSVSRPKRLGYLAGLLVFLLGYHLALNEPGRPASEVLPLFAIMIWGDLVRELVASRTVGTDDPEVRARRKHLAAIAFVASAVTIAVFVVAMLREVMPGKLAGYLWLALFMSLGATGLGLCVNDSARDAARIVVAERQDPPFLASLFLPLVAAGIVAYAAWTTWSDWSNQHALSTPRIAGLLMLTVMLMFGVRSFLRYHDEYQDRAQALLDSTKPE